MINIVICEDEPPILRSIEKKVILASNDYKVIDKAYDGLSVIKILNNSKVDILITDMNIPIISGMKLLEIVKKDFPSILIIVISGYQDFKYLQTAIRNGATDYLLKPVKNEELERALMKCSKIIEQREIENNLDFITKLVNKKNPSNLSLLANTHCLLSIINISNFVHYDVLDSLYLDRLRFSFKTQIAEYFKNNKNAFIVDSNGSFLFLILLNEKDESKVKSLFYHLESHNTIPFSLIFKTSILNSFEITNDINIMLKQIDEYTIFEKKQIVEVPESVLSKFQFTHNQNTILSISIQTKDKDMFFNCIDRIMKNFETHNTTSDKIKNFLNLLFYIISTNSNFEFTLKQFTESVLENSFTYKELKFNLNLIVSSIFYENSENNTHKQLAQKVQNYIDNNYFNNITNKELSSYFNLVPSYINTIFKKYKKQSLNEYITNLRIKKAKELLLIDNILLKEIAFSVGYNDPLYFSRIFKKKTGLSPSEFRKNNCKLNNIIN